jgi:Rps23 Pro-64 3,4-dihydroxylase Tpa1-like proline 4-hydroxylase
LPADEHEALLAWALANEAILVPSHTARGLDPTVRLSLSTPPGIQPMWKLAMVERVRGLLPELCDALGMPRFELLKIDSQLVAYRDGGFVAPHTDTATGVTRQAGDRVLSAVYHFFREPTGFTGGELRLMPPVVPPPAVPQKLDLVPRQNTLVAFTAWAPHAVLPVHCPSGKFEDSRFAINFCVRRALQ